MNDLLHFNFDIFCHFDETTEQKQVTFSKLKEIGICKTDKIYFTSLVILIFVDVQQMVYAWKAE